MLKTGINCHVRNRGLQNKTEKVPCTVLLNYLRLQIPLLNASGPLQLYLFIYLFIYLVIYVFIYLFIYLVIYIFTDLLFIYN